MLQQFPKYVQQSLLSGCRCCIQRQTKRRLYRIL